MWLCQAELRGSPAGNGDLGSIFFIARPFTVTTQDGNGRLKHALPCQGMVTKRRVMNDRIPGGCGMTRRQQGFALNDLSVTTALRDLPDAVERQRDHL